MYKRSPLEAKYVQGVNGNLTIKGLIFNIQRYSLHDGPGIRTTVFMKGCPLRCFWCCNPESQNSHTELIVSSAKCNKCGKCEEVCPVEAISVTEQGIIIDRVKCTLCMKCVDVCPTGAIVISGHYASVQEVMAEVERDRIFYRNSGGGVTISGGEPLFQWQFSYHLLKACKQKGLHTALDTCGYGSWTVMEKVIECTDLVLFDVKHMDSKRHSEGTGKSNLLILSNARKMAKVKVKNWLRMAVIPGYNDSEEHIKKVAELGLEMGAEKISILLYHEYGKSKYKALGRDYTLRRVQPPSSECVQKTKTLFEGFGLKTSIGN